MSVSRRAVAPLLAAALVWHASGVAGALELDPVVHCCCGDHDAGHHCGCPDCPGSGTVRLRGARPAAEPEPSAPSFRECAGRRSQGALPTLPIFVPGIAAGSIAPREGCAQDFPAPQELRDRAPHSDRPPP
jgi:hypothetical protein